MKGVFIIEERDYLVVDRFGNVMDNMFAVPVGTIVKSMCEDPPAKSFKEKVSSKKHLFRSDSPFTILLRDGAIRFSNLKPTTVIRLIYLSTYLSYDSNILFYKRNQKMNKTTLADALGISRKTADEFFADACGANILIDSPEGLRLDPTVFCRGTVASKNVILIKLYHYSVKAMYETTDFTTHKYIGYLFKAIPYLNTEWNTLSYNILETDWMRVRPLSPVDFCEAVGYAKTHSKRLIDQFNNIRFPCKGSDQLVCRVCCDPETGDTSLVINPFLVSAAHNVDRILELGSFMEEALAYRESKRIAKEVNENDD